MQRLMRQSPNHIDQQGIDSELFERKCLVLAKATLPGQENCCLANSNTRVYINRMKPAKQTNELITHQRKKMTQKVNLR
jgi:hypothetical protein